MAFAFYFFSLSTYITAAVGKPLTQNREEANESQQLVTSHHQGKSQEISHGPEQRSGGMREEKEKKVYKLYKGFFYFDSMSFK